MSFRFKWDEFDPDFHARAALLLTQALNKGPKPPILTSDIAVKELDMGEIAPELEILEIGDISSDRFRGILKLTYNGDASVVLQTRVQANPLCTYLETTPDFTSPNMLGAAVPLTIPLFVRLSEIRLSGIIILVFSKQKGCTVFFRNDPLESIRVSSTFDGIPAIAQYLQREIESQLRVLFREDLPAIIHKLSLSWFNSPPPEPVTSSEPRQYPDFENIGSCDELLALLTTKMTLAVATPHIQGVIHRPVPGVVETRLTGTRSASSSISSASSYTEIQRLALRGFGEAKKKRRRRVVRLSPAVTRSEPEAASATASTTRSSKEDEEKAYILAQMVDAAMAKKVRNLV